MAQGFPVKEKLRQKDYNLMFAREGVAISPLRNSLGGNIAPFISIPYQTAVVQGQFRPRVGRAFYIEELILSCVATNTQGDYFYDDYFTGFELRVGNLVDPTQLFTTPLSGGTLPFVRSGENLPIKVGNFVRQGAGVFANVYPFARAGTNDVLIWPRISVSGGYEITDDFNFNAAKRILVVGDSVLDLEGCTDSEFGMAFQIASYYKSKGQDVQLINKALSGMTSLDFVKMEKDNWYDIDDIDLVIYCLGINDTAVTTWSDANVDLYRTNLQYFINMYKNSKFPDVPTIIFGSTPIESDEKTTHLDLLRTTCAQEVDAANLALGKAEGDEIYFYCNLAGPGAFDRKVLSNFSPLDPILDHKHPTNGANVVEYLNIIEPFLDANIPTI